MMCRAILAAVLAAAGLVPVLRAAQQPTFRTTLDVVTVNVSVRDDNRPVTGLRAADFEIKDNGVVQTISDLDFEAVPVDVTFAFDASGSTVRVLEQFKSDARAMTRLLRPIDRMRLLVIDTSVHEAMPLQPAGSAGRPLDSLPGGGLSSVYDTLVAALVAPNEPGRRRLVVALTDGIDTYSSVTPEMFREVAARSDAVLQVMHAEPEWRGYRGRRSPTHLDQRARAAFVPYNGKDIARTMWGSFDPFMRSAYRHEDMDLLRAAAEGTGGELHAPGVLGRGTVAAFRRLFDEFKQSYLLHFTPTGVQKTGWHELQVTVPKSPALTVRARRGYASAAEP